MSPLRALVVPVLISFMGCTAGSEGKKSDLALLSHENVPVVSGEEVACIAERMDSEAGQKAVIVELNSAGTGELRAYTRENVGKVLKIRVCGEIVSEPLIKAEISGGSFPITGIDDAGLSCLKRAFDFKKGCGE